jgi:hypothetical protein
VVILASTRMASSGQLYFAFHGSMVDIYHRASRELGYNATYFVQSEATHRKC